MTQAEKPSWKALTKAQKLDVLQEYWIGGGVTAEQLAAMFCDATKNMIIGHVHRAKLHRGKVVAMRGERGPRKARVPTKRKIVAANDETPPAGEFDELAPSRVQELIRTLREPLPGCPPVALLDLPERPRPCRFPVQGGYCGCPAMEDRPYCETHYAIAYTRVPKAKGRG